MKTQKFYFVLIVLVGIFFSSCCQSEITRKQEEKKALERFKTFYEQPHELRKMINYQSLEGSFSGGFFIFFGAMEGEMNSPLKVTFSWKTDREIFITTTLDITKIVVKFNNERKNPVVSFGYCDPMSLFCDWKRLDEENPSSINELMRYAVIECKESDWIQDVSLPLENVHY